MVYLLKSLPLRLQSGFVLIITMAAASALPACGRAHGELPALGTHRSHPYPCRSGPKGVIQDWRRFKQLETEQREEQCREMERLIQKLSMSCRSHLDEEEEQRKQKDLEEKISGKVIGPEPGPSPKLPWLLWPGQGLRQDGEVWELCRAGPGPRHTRDALSALLPEPLGKQLPF